MKKILNVLRNNLNRLLKPTNISKAIVIFVIGIISRYFINDYFNTNVFTEYLTFISISYYSFIAVLVVFINDMFNYYNFSIIPNFIFTFYYQVCYILEFIFIKPFLYLHYIFNKPIIFNISYIENTDNGTRCHLHRQLHEKPYDYNSFRQRIVKQTPNNEYQNQSHDPFDYMDENSYTNYEYPEYSQEYTTNNHDYSQEYNNQGDNYYEYNQGYNTDYQYSYTNEEYHNTPRTSDPRFFVVETVNQNGINRTLNTPRIGSNTYIPHKLSPVYETHEPTNANFSNYETYNYNPSSGNAYTDMGITQTNTQYPPQISAWSESSLDSGMLTSNEIRIKSPNTKGKVSLGIKFLNTKNNVHSMYVKYHDITKRKFFWKIWEKGRGNYESYEDFKLNFDPKTKVWKEISKTTKSDLSKEIRDLLDTNPFGKQRSVTLRDIRGITHTQSQKHLNLSNASRNKSLRLSKR